MFCPNPSSSVGCTLLCIFVFQLSGPPAHTIRHPLPLFYCILQLWRRFHSALAWVLEEADDGDLFDGVDSAVVGECLDEFKNFYTSRRVLVVFLCTRCACLSRFVEEGAPSKRSASSTSR